MPGRVGVLPVQFEPLTTLGTIPANDAALMDELFKRPGRLGIPRIVISQHYPPWLPTIDHDFAIALFAWEESLIPANLIRSLNKFTGVMAASAMVAKALVDSGLRVPLRITGLAIELGAFLRIGDERLANAAHGITPRAPMVFLHISSCFPRKGVDLLLAAWARAFTSADPVRLVIKGFHNEHNQTAEQIATLSLSDDTLAPIELINEELSAFQLADLYRDADCMVLPTRGEGFNMVAAEAMAANLPLIVTGHGGHMDFVDARSARLLDFTFRPSRSHVTSAHSFWVEPSLGDLTLALREALDDHLAGGSQALERSSAARAIARRQFDTRAWAERTIDACAGLIQTRSTPAARIAWLSSWGIRCGIAEYSRFLLDHRPLRGLAKVPELIVLCDIRTGFMPSIPKIHGGRVVPAWHVASGSIARQISGELLRSEPQMLVIQHQPGLISWLDLVEIIDLTRVICIKTVVTLHSTASIALIETALRASVLLGLAAVERVVVHSLHDLETLRRFGIIQNVALIPHGAGVTDITARRPTRNLTASPIIGCYGFFLPHKGIATLIAAFAQILETWPSATLRLVNAEYPSPLSAIERSTCQTLARQLAIYESIEWEQDYLADTDAIALLAGCDLIVMPYGATPESASGAVRLALASGVPVAVSMSPIFDDLGGSVHRVDATTASSLGDAITGLLDNDAKRLSVVAAAEQWLREHDWNVVSGQLFGMIEGIHQQPSSFGRQWPMVFAADSPLLFSVVGLMQGKSRWFNGISEGYGVSGPYMRLSPGQYTVEFAFDKLSGLSGSARFEVAMNGGLDPIASRAVDFGHEACNHHRIRLEFSIDAAALDVEFRVFCDIGFRAKFIDITVDVDQPERYISEGIDL
ncbi:glycosyltransferase [Acidisphaera sp. L21]|uniref:glycosyltransferase family 4 protein n=1 Tax=Acidisphaera sp. L21 TaxID=1641851 RepID=UPI0020B15F94|nr:glycosyltransferase [Acidisphaera sp. L21]